MSSPKNFLAFLWELVGELVAPSFCCHCLALGPWLCRSCLRHIKLYDTALSSQLLPNYLDEIFATAVYQPPLNRLVHTMKYQHGQPIAEWCGEFIFALSWQRHPEFFHRVMMITAVPLHRHRQEERGFNQAEVIAQTLARCTGLPYFPLLRRARATSYQAATRSREERQKNLLGAFMLNPTVPSGFLKGKNILIIDDVLTTGSTANECARILKEAGATTTSTLVIAHGK